MERSGASMGYDAAWDAHCVEQDRWAGYAAGAVGALFEPSWIFLDMVALPDLWRAYAPGRLAFGLVCVAFIVFSRRIHTARWMRSTMAAVFLLGGAVISVTVPLAGPWYAEYALTQSLMMWAGGCVVGLPLRWNALIFGGIFVEFLLAHVLLGWEAEPTAILAATLYLTTAAALCTGSSWVRFRQRAAAFKASWDLERRNEQLADSRLVVLEERAIGAAKNAFLERMSHELRTPLNAILGYTEMAREVVEDEGLEEPVADLDKATKAGKHLLALLSDILDLTAIESGGVPFEPVELELERLLVDVVDDVRPAASAKSLLVHVEGDSTPRVVHDPNRLRQILVALLSNAVKFTPSGSVTAAVGQEGDGVWLTVTDTGVGIAPERLAPIFEAFRQGDGSSTRRHDGSGLGLALARGLARRMGGDIEVASAPGEGSCFTVRLPREHPVTGIGRAASPSERASRCA